MSHEGLTKPSQDLEGRVAAWLASEADAEVPDWLLVSVSEITRGQPQERRLGSRLTGGIARLVPWMGAGTGQRLDMMGALRLVGAAVIVVAISLGTALGIPAVFRSLSAPGPGSPAEAAHATELFEVTLDGDAIPEDLAGVLFFRKVYPTDQEVAYGPGFVPPNTFVRYVESGELAIRPRSDVQVIRAGGSWTDAEVVAADEEALLLPGDTFVMQDVPFEAFGSEALGSMTTPGEDARVVGFAIRESSRCCSMTHSGMQSPWYHTLVKGVEALRGEPVTLALLRWDVPTGAVLPPLEDGLLALRVVDVGTITGTVERAVPSSAGIEGNLTFAEGGVIQLPGTPQDGDTVRLANAGPSTAVVYQIMLEPGAAGAPDVPLATVSASAPMLKARSGHSATLLANGRVLLAGGGCPEVELFDPESGVSEPAGEMSSIRTSSATLLEDGRVLLAGGSSDPAEAFDLRVAAVVPIGPMVEERHFQSATRMHDGRVLVIGGETATAEIFDPDTETFTATGPMSVARAKHVSVLLRDNRVLVAGGGTPVLELYDPVTGRFTPSTAPTVQDFDRGTATRLGDGRVLLIGHGAPAQLYDPESDTVTTVGPMVTPRYAHAAALLDDGRVLIAGGLDAESLTATASLEVFDPGTLTFEAVGSLSVPRWTPAATKLCDGSVLVSGGTGGTAPMVSTELVTLTTQS